MRNTFPDEKNANSTVEGEWDDRWGHFPYSGPGFSGIENATSNLTVQEELELFQIITDRIAELKKKHTWDRTAEETKLLPRLEKAWAAFDRRFSDLKQRKESRDREKIVKF